jgi:prepilin-type N-terminal cleavage/methylation domain-containing protein
VNATRRPEARRPGFTLIELTIVIAIIGLIVAFILVASYEGVQRAEIRATQALIAKLETGMTDRMEALLSVRVDPNMTHLFMANVYPTPLPVPLQPTATAPGGLAGPGRAHILARFDQIKRELPDVFFVRTIPGSVGVNDYPLNFASQPYNSTGTPFFPSLATFAPVILPLGHALTWNPGGNSFGGYPLPPPTTNVPLPSDYKPAGEGIFGASYNAAAGIYKNLGNVPPEQLSPGTPPKAYLPKGYDSTDNDGDGLVDEWDEGVDATNIAAVTKALQNHTHKTARSEMLYAILVEGQGPLGSTFSRDDFTTKEIQDTDGDGLPEFVDAWGEPIQFYRWPIHFTGATAGAGSTGPATGLPDLQKGFAAYSNATEPRQQDPLDPNGQIVAPAWWWSASNTGISGDPFGSASGQVSSRALAFQSLFHSLVDYQEYFDSNGSPPPNLPQPPNGPPPAPYWDRGNFLARRAYFTKPLIVSSGPDRMLGTAMLNFDYSNYDPNVPGGFAAPVDAAHILLVENTASSLSPFRDFTKAPYFPPDTSAVSPPLNALLPSWKLDDISNQTLQSAAGGIQR